MIVRAVKAVAFVVAAFVLFVIALLIQTRTIVFAAQAPGIARVDCATATVIVGQALDYTDQQRKELMRRYGVTPQDVRSILERCNIKTELRR